MVSLIIDKRRKQVMTINDLIKALQKYDGQQPIYVWDDMAGSNIPVTGVSLFYDNHPHSGDNPLSIDWNMHN